MSTCHYSMCLFIRITPPVESLNCCLCTVILFLKACLTIVIYAASPTYENIWEYMRTLNTFFETPVRSHFKVNAWPDLNLYFEPSKRKMQVPHLGPLNFLTYGVVFILSNLVPASDYFRRCYCLLPLIILYVLNAFSFWFLQKDRYILVEDDVRLHFTWIVYWYIR